MRTTLAFTVLLVAIGAEGVANAGSDYPSPASTLREARKEARLTNAAVLPGDTGDPDSFGRAVKYIGQAQTSIVTATVDCTPDPTNPPGKNDRCIVLSPQPATNSIHETALAAVHLPAGASHSLICYEFTPFAAYHTFNTTTAPQSSRYTFFPEVVVKNDVLKDPSLIDPTTGAPFNGQLTMTFSMLDERRQFAPGEQAFHSFRMSRGCGAGIISKDLLKSVFGLNDTQATRFFSAAIDLSFGAIGFLKLQDDTNYFYDVRLYGD